MSIRSGQLLTLAIFLLPASVLAIEPIKNNGTSSALEPAEIALASPHLALTDVTEWIALGDSYAAGVGNGDLLEVGICFRFTEAYPQQLQNDPQLLGPANGRKFTNAVCSGATSQDVLDWQLLDHSTFEVGFGSRPAFGQPQFATITFGGNDADFVGVVNSCIYEFFPLRTCEDQLAHSLNIIRSPDLSAQLDKTIGTITAKGQEAQGESFKLYVTGYPEFFNAETDECSNISWSIWPGWPGSQQKITKELRRAINVMGNELTEVLLQAVEKHQDQGAVFVPWNDVLDGHRFCEEGVVQPEVDNPDVWLFGLRQQHSDDDSKHQSLRDKLAQVVDPLVNDAKAFVRKHHENSDKAPSDINPNITTTRDLWNAIHEADQGGHFADAALEGIERIARVFHPKAVALNEVARLIFEKLEGVNVTGAALVDGA
ncbi:MAG: hypothetical protein M1837_007130 [Sclerophora amabilis]|nr:MAG: hypothetical protein M1837_007130 [Sclerophora amabilis]